MCVLGAAGDTSNLGVDALLESTLAGARRFVPDAEITVFDNGLGRRSGEVLGPDGPVDFERLGIRDSRRIQRRESLANMSLALRYPVFPNLGVDRLRSAAVVLDLSGGDSFSDIYGLTRFRAVTRPKELVLAAGTPLVLLPQTYGPFTAQENELLAARIVARATLAWARDLPSFEVLRALLGDSFDERRHQVSVDVAFGLPAHEPRRLHDDVRTMLLGNRPVFGINVSGLLTNDEKSHEKFGLRQPHEPVVRRLIESVLDRTDATILLVPHVRSDLWVVESDIAACRRLHQLLRARYPGRVLMLENVDRAAETKWVIGRCDAFCGTRMHSVIAALSSGTPAMALAYSPKTAGVLESCGQGSHVVDLRTADAGQVADHAVRLWTDRVRVAADLEERIPSVIERSQEPFAAIAELIAGSTTPIQRVRAESGSTP